MNELREHLAIEVLEWVPGETEYQWNDKYGNRKLDGVLFEPDTNIEQAMGLMGKFKNWSINQYPDGELSVEVIVDNTTFIVSSGDISLAICHAAAKATNFKGEL